ncbi:hypothetical protein V3C99_004895 [Haemonchus contortus]
MVWLGVSIIFAVATLTSGQAPTECGDPARPIAKKDVLNGTVKLPDSYKISGVISNWISNTTHAFTEAANAEVTSTLFSSRNDSLQWLAVKNDASQFFYNRTSGICEKSTSLPLTPFPELSAISSNLTSFSTLLSGLVEFSNKEPGELVDEKVVAGVEGVRWVSCVNGTNGTNNFQIEVVFAGVWSLKPPSAAFNNPLVQSVQISEYGNFSDKKSLKSQLSVEFDRYDTVAADESQLFSTPSGTICSGWKEANIPLTNASDPFNVFIEMTDQNKETYKATVYYSAKEELVIVSGSKKDGSMIFTNESGTPDGAVSVIHDFGKGYEYALGHTRCLGLSALPNNSADVVRSEGTVSMRPLADILVAPELKFGNYGQVKTDDNRTVNVFRTFDNKTGDVIELHFDGNWLEKYMTFKLTDGRPSLASYSRYSQSTPMRASQYNELIRACFAKSSKVHNDNNTFILDVKSRSVENVYSVGVETVSSALAKALSQIAPINPHRVRVFYSSGPDDSLRVFFSVDEKTDKEPSIVPKYNFSAEVSTDEFMQKLNETISKGDWKFSVVSADEKTEDWIVAARSLSRYAPSSPPSTKYAGYTGGAMFVLGVFSLLLGVAIGAGGVFFVTKRQRISTLAYQVFE